MLVSLRHLGIYSALNNRGRGGNDFGISVHYIWLLSVQVPVPKSLLTTLGLLSLLICCSGQWGFASNCSATIRLDQIFASNVTGNYIAVLEIVSCLSRALLHTIAPVVAVDTLHSMQYLYLVWPLAVS